MALFWACGMTNKTIPPNKPAGLPDRAVVCSMPCVKAVRRLQAAVTPVPVPPIGLLTLIETVPEPPSPQRCEALVSSGEQLPQVESLQHGVGRCLARLLLFLQLAVAPDYARNTKRDSVVANWANGRGPRCATGWRVQIRQLDS